MVAQFQLQLFGSPQLVRGRALVRFRTKKHLAVLLYLHFEGRARAISRDRLVDLLWPDVPADKGRHSLSQALLAIRSRLGTDAVTGREQDVQLLAEFPSDLSALRQGQVATVRVAEPLGARRMRRRRIRSLGGRRAGPAQGPGAGCPPGGAPGHADQRQSVGDASPGGSAVRG